MGPHMAWRRQQLRDERRRVREEKDREKELSRARERRRGDSKIEEDERAREKKGKRFICPGRDRSRAKGPSGCQAGPIEGVVADVALKWTNQNNWSDVYTLPAQQAT